MHAYLLRRLLLLPLTLFCIVLVNFVIINLAPGDPVGVVDVGPDGGASKKQQQASAFGSDEKYLQFREFYGLTLPVLFNTWPFLSKNAVENTLDILISKKKDGADLPVKDLDALRVKMGDEARFVMPILHEIMNEKSTPIELKKMASRFFARGGSRPAHVGASLSREEMVENQQIGQNSEFLKSHIMLAQDSPEETDKKLQALNKWYEEQKLSMNFSPSFSEKVRMFFFDTRFFKYMGRVLRLDFGSLRNDQNRSVISEVVKRFKYSLTLSVIPMVITLFLSLFLGLLMAIYEAKLYDHLLNFILLILFAIPIFVVAPFLIEKVALNRTFPFTNIPFPLSGFTSPDAIYNNLTSSERLFDILRHIFLPLIAILYGGLAAQARISRTAILEVKRQDFVRTAYAKGAASSSVYLRHIGRNAAITLITSVAGSLGVVLGGSLIVETLFQIDGFGKFFYDAVVNRDYNVIMFSTLAGSFLTLLGYLTADLAYTALDPRVSLE